MHIQITLRRIDEIRPNQAQNRTDVIVINGRYYILTEELKEIAPEIRVVGLNVNYDDIFNNAVQEAIDSQNYEYILEKSLSNYIIFTSDDKYKLSALGMKLLVNKINSIGDTSYLDNKDGNCVIKAIL